jgi:hypothetical protein
MVSAPVCQTLARDLQSRPTKQRETRLELATLTLARYASNSVFRRGQIWPLSHYLPPISTGVTRGSTLTTRASTLVTNEGRRRGEGYAAADRNALPLAASLHARDSVHEREQAGLGGDARARQPHVATSCPARTIESLERLLSFGRTMSPALCAAGQRDRERTVGSWSKCSGRRGCAHRVGESPCSSRQRAGGARVQRTSFSCALCHELSRSTT